MSGFVIHNNWEEFLAMLHVVKPHAIQFRHVVIIQGIKDLPAILATANQSHLTQSTQLV